MKRCRSDVCYGRGKKAILLNRTASNPIDSGGRNDLGLFDSLPMELKYRALSYLSNVSKQMSLLVQIYTNTSHCVQLREFRNPHHVVDDTRSNSFRALCDKYKKIGTLYRHLNADLPRSSCLFLLEHQLSGHMCSHGILRHGEMACSKKLFDSATISPNDNQHDETSVMHNLSFVRCPSLYFFGYFLREFTCDWSEEDQRRAFHSLVQLCFQENFWKRLTTLICQDPGYDPTSELSVRMFLRRIFLDPVALPELVMSPNLKASSSEAPLPDVVHIQDPHSERRKTQQATTSHVLFPNQLVQSTESDASHNYSFSPVASSSFVVSECNLEPSNNFSCSSFIKTPSTLDTNKTSRSTSEHSSELHLSAPLVIRPSNTSMSNSSAHAPLYWKAAKPLLNILHSYPFAYQARILFILYGPIHKGRLMWRTMCENTAADSQQLATCFGELGNVLQNMLQSGCWGREEILALLDAITSSPEDWLAENVACLLYTSGPRIASMMITRKAINGQIGELAITLTSLCLIRVKIRASLTDVVGLVGEACRAAVRADRHNFLDHLARAFQDVIVDLYETDELDDRIEDFSTILRAQGEFMRALMSRVYEE